MPEEQYQNKTGQLIEGLNERHQYLKSELSKLKQKMTSEVSYTAETEQNPVYLGTEPKFAELFAMNENSMVDY